MKRLILTIGILILVFLVSNAMELIIFPEMSMKVGVGQLADSNEAFEALQATELTKRVFNTVVFSVAGLLSLIIWWKPIKFVLRGK